MDCGVPLVPVSGGDGYDHSEWSQDFSMLCSKMCLCGSMAQRSKWCCTEIRSCQLLEDSVFLFFLSLSNFFCSYLGCPKDVKLNVLLFYYYYYYVPDSQTSGSAVTCHYRASLPLPCLPFSNPFYFIFNGTNSRSTDLSLQQKAGLFGGRVNFPIHGSSLTCVYWTRVEHTVQSYLVCVPVFHSLFQIFHFACYVDAIVNGEGVRSALFPKLCVCDDCCCHSPPSIPPNNHPA